MAQIMNVSETVMQEACRPHLPRNSTYGGSLSARALDKMSAAHAEQTFLAGIWYEVGSSSCIWVFAYIH